MFDGIGGPTNPSIHYALITNVFGVPFLTYLFIFLLLSFSYSVFFVATNQKKMISINVGVASINWKKNLMHVLDFNANGLNVPCIFKMFFQITCLKKSF
jgi:hypothetical protein